MRTLSLGIHAEGSSDVEFFSGLLVRLSMHLLQTRAHHPAQVADVEALPGRPKKETFRDTVTDYAHRLDVVVVHADANGDWQRAMNERIEPLFTSVRGGFPTDSRLVPVVPARATEAWMLSDIAALNRVFGTSMQRNDLELPNHVRDVEQITDPKATLKQAQIIALGRRQARKVGAGPLFTALGWEVSLDELGNVPSFSRFATDFKQSLQDLGFLRTD